MNKSILMATLIAAFALTACGKKEEAAPAAPAPMAAPAAADVAAAASEVAASASEVAGMAAAAASEAASK